MPDLEFTESPLLRECYEFDFKHSFKGPLEYYQLATRADSEKWKKLLIEDWRYRAMCRMNNVMQIYGNQGTGKTTMAIAIAIAQGIIFHQPWKVSETIFRWEDVNKAISTAKQGQTILADEQMRANYGVMGNMVNINISDFEDQLRRRQINLIYNSPERRRHSTFIEFKTLDTFPRHTGKIECCEDCATGKIPVGYPICINAMLYIKRHSDNEFMPRAIISFLPPPLAIMEEYDIYKNAHLDRLQAGRRDKLNPVFEDAEAIFKKHMERIILNGHKIEKVIRLKQIVFEEIGDGKYTNEGYSFLIDRLKYLAEQYLNGDSNDLREPNRLGGTSEYGDE